MGSAERGRRSESEGYRGLEEFTKTHRKECEQLIAGRNADVYPTAGLDVLVDFDAREVIV